MKKLKLLYNPYSGDKTFKYSLDAVIQVFQHCGHEVHIYRSDEGGSIEDHIAQMYNEYDLMVVAGGDGTVGQAVNAMMLNRINCPLGIISSGTANDFATFLKMPDDHQKAAEAIAYGKSIKVDLGLVSGFLPSSALKAMQRYFINVCGAGLLTNISQNIDLDFKDTLGKLAYYIEGIGQIPNFVPIPVRVTTNTSVTEENIYFFIVLNSAGTGGFQNLSPSANINDGLFDFIAIKACPVRELAVLFLKVLAGDYLSDANVIFLRDSYFKIESINGMAGDIFSETDIDGERGPDMPIIIKNIPRAIDIIVPSWETW